MNPDKNGLVKTGEYTAVNPNFQAPVSSRVADINRQLANSPTGALGFTQSVNNTPLTGGAVINSSGNVQVPTTITSESLKGGETPINLPPITSISTTAPAISAGVQSQITNAKNEYDRLSQEYLDKAKTEVTSNRSKAEEYLGLGKQTIDERIQAMQAPDFKAKKEARDKAYENLQTLQAQKIAELDAIDREQNVVGNAKQVAINQVNSKYAIKELELSITSDLADRKYNSALESINQVAQLKMEAYQPYINYYTQLANNKDNDFTQAERDLLKSKADEYKYQQTQEVENTKANGEAMAKYNSLGAGITINDTAEQRAQKIAKVGGELGYQTQLEKIKNNASITAGLGADAPLYNGLSSATATAVRGIVSGFKSEPQLTNFATIQDGYNFTQKISDTTTNPADDQALIYSLAKALDPGSVVREGEYATAQKYAQSWVKAYGKSITQAIAGTGFLSEEARKNIKNVIETKYKSSKVSYDNLYNQYAKQINNLTGRDDGTKFLRDYSVDTNAIKNNQQTLSNEEAYAEYQKITGQIQTPTSTTTNQTMLPTGIENYQNPFGNFNSIFK